MKSSSKKQQKSTKSLRLLFSKAADFEEQTEDDVRKLGFVQKDKRFNRTVITLPGHFVVIKDLDVLRFYADNKLLDKYSTDWTRMSPSFDAAVIEANRDKDSRQLMVFNDENFKEVKQCFTHMQFIMTRRKEYDMYVYQRSADMAKFRDDMTFFASVAESFGMFVKFPVTKIVVVYGSIHVTK